MLFVNVPKISIQYSLCPNSFFFSFFFLHKMFPMLTFPPFKLMFHSIFFNSINLSFTSAVSIQFLSYSVIHNVIFLDIVLTIKTRTAIPNFRTDRIYVCINLTIVVVFIHYIHYVVLFIHLYTFYRLL